METETFFGKTPLVYIVIFLRNGGEKIRAIWLAKEALHLSLDQAKEWVETVTLINGPDGEVASHWPPSVTEYLKANP